jgi:hypothetical protein
MSKESNEFTSHRWSSRTIMTADRRHSASAGANLIPSATNSHPAATSSSVIQHHKHRHHSAHVTHSYDPPMGWTMA